MATRISSGKLSRQLLKRLAAIRMHIQSVNRHLHVGLTDHIDQALDRFANVFVPLLRADSFHREIKAVDGEFQAAIQRIQSVASKYSQSIVRVATRISYTETNDR